MRKLSLFSGIGGIDLAAKWAGIETAAFCEKEPFPQKVLRRHWPNTPIYDDVCTLTREVLERDGIITRNRTIDLISAGYPCQPFSNAGKRKGKEDDRHLWPEVARLLQEIRPRWFIGENVAGHITLGLDDVLSDLESIGYDTQAIIIPACAVGAPHRRDRVFIIGFLPNSNSFRHQRTEQLRKNHEQVTKWGKSTFRPITKLFDDTDWKERAMQSGFLGGNHGVPNRLDRIRGLGNAVVPYQVYPFLAAIKAINDQIQGE
ncbi:DNA (cytosine-5-)-methyltransferase [Paenibacillus larvae]